MKNIKIIAIDVDGTLLNSKKEQVKMLSEKMKEAKIILLTEYRGINVSDDTLLRKEIRENGNYYLLTKN